MSSSSTLRVGLPAASGRPSLSPARPRPAQVLAPRFAWALGAFTLFIVLGLWAWVGFQIHRESEEALAQAELNLGNLTRAFAEHTVKTVEGADQTLRFVRRDYLAQGDRLDLASYLERTAMVDSAYWLLSVIGPHGHVSHSSMPFMQVDLSDRAHFRVHAEGLEDRLFISKPVFGRVSEKWSIQLTRRIEHPDGRFGGVVVLSLSPDYLTNFYQEVDLGRDGSISLVGFDGVVRARAVGDNRESGQVVSGDPLFEEARRRKVGARVASGGVDGIERVWAYRALDDYDLVVFAGMRTDEVLKEPRRRRMAYLAVAALTTLTLVAFMTVLLRAVRRQHGLVARLRDSERRANVANEMKTKFLASISHELRTPLNGILGYAELIRDTAREAEAREYGGIVHQSAQHLHSLVNTLLDLAKIESGRMRLSIRPLALGELVEEVVRLNAVFAESRGLALELARSPQAPATIESDRTRLVQVLNNLLSNAIKFTDRGGVVLRVAPDPDGVLIVVQDSGIGIPAAQLETLFTRFHATTTEFVHPAQGAGLGLPLARELTELLGGTLEIESAEGQGTRVLVRLPLTAPAPEEDRP
ncbi:hybrid sensor histidine kinase/response regulator [Caldimonas tepidiphila]|uniref:sensor histidine kinase n=1 Tax=Caldimonas tepidiphila TaxID=2315841 RepID=UPI000E5B2D51|nr:hybrid sensor histidine kinase/response regulator [Caldimonas tepidiphila]